MPAASARARNVEPADRLGDACVGDGCTDEPVEPSPVAHWLALAVLFVAMAADEAASLHELLQKPLRAALGSETWLRYPLILPGLILAVIIGLRFRRFTQTIGATRRRLVTGAAIFALGALVFEMIGGWFAPEAIGANATYLALTTTEEALELTGASVVLLALLRHVAHEAGRNGLPVRDRSWPESASRWSAAS